MDNWVYHQSLKGSDDDVSPFISRKVAYISDTNQGTYSGGQVQLDTASFSNSGLYASWAESYVEIPLVVTLSASTTAGVSGFGAATCNFAAGLKNGFHQLIDGLQIQFENTTVVPNTPFTNMYVSYKLLTTFSRGDTEKIGPSIGWWPDSTSSFEYNSSAAASGQGICNNKNFGWENLYANSTGKIYADTASASGAQVTASAAVVAGGAVGGLYTAALPNPSNTNQTAANFGFFKRQQCIAFNPSVAPHSSFVSLATAKTIAKSVYEDSGSDTGYKAWYITARVYLRHLHNFFEALPLVRGAYLRINLNLNLASTNITVASRTASAGTPTGIKLSMASPTLSSHTNPLMIASGEIGQGACNLPAGTYTLQCAISKAVVPSNSVTLSHSLSSLRLYIPLYQFKTDFEQSYLASPVKTVTYRDIVQYQYTGLTAGSTMNFLATNGLVDAKTLIIVPVLSASSNGGTGISPIQGVFSTEPATTSPLAVVTDFNVKVGGLPLLPSNIYYDWEMFANELQQQNAISGGLCDGIQSGLINEQSFGFMHRYMVVDLSRRTTSGEDKVPKSLEIFLKNASLLTMDYYIFVEVEKTINISQASGTLMP